MLVGIPYHASLVFSNTPWFVNSEHSRALFDVMGDFLHIWRMPLFFILAGFFAGLIVARKGDRVWLTDRVKRLGLPLLTGLLVINTLQIVLVEELAGDLSPAAFFNALAHPQTWVGQLWFLIDLLVFAVLYVMARLWAPARRGLDGVGRLIAPATSSTGGRVALIVVVATVLCGASYLWEVTGENLKLPLQNLFLLGVCFVFGSALAHSRATLAAVTPQRWSRIGLVAVAALLAAITTLGIQRSLGGTSGAVLEVWTSSVATLLIGATLLGVASRWGNRSSPLVRWLVDASLIIYLLHHPLVIAYGALLGGAHPVVGFVLLVVVVFVTCAAVYEVIARFAPTRLLFNGSARPLTTFGDVVRRTPQSDDSSTSLPRHSTTTLV